jgi:anti-sigma B factor antagonist
MTTARLELARFLTPSGHVVVLMEGELDLTTAEEAYAYLHETILQSQAAVTVDASGLRFCGAAGLRVLTHAASDARVAGCPLTITAMHPSLLKIIRVTGLHRAYPELLPSP